MRNISINIKSKDSNMNQKTLIRTVLPENTNYLPIHQEKKIPIYPFAGYIDKKKTEISPELFEKQRKENNALAYNCKNYGVRCFNLICVDCDMYKGNGHEDIPFENCKNTLVQKTGSGGKHYIYLRDERMQNWKPDTDIIDGLSWDIKIGKNSYFMGAGSTNKKGKYEIINSVKPITMPDNLFNLINGYYTSKADPNIEIKINKKEKPTIKKTIEEIKFIINKCPPKYFESRKDWHEIGWAMHFENHSLACKELYKFKSRQLEQYKNEPDNVYDDMWEKANIKNSKQRTLASVVQKLKKDGLWETKSDNNKPNIDDILYTGTHADLADIAVSIIGDDYIYCEGNDSIYNWNKTYWKPISKEYLIFKINKSLSEFYKNLINEALQKPNNSGFKELSKVFLLVKNNNLIKSVSKFFIYSIKQVEITDLNKNDYEFVFNNCCINLKTGKKNIPQKNKYATLCAGYDYVESSTKQREQLTKVLSTILSNKEIRQFTLLLLSTALVGIPIAKFIIFKGAGRNGKGTLNEIMRIMMGDYYYKLNHKTLIKSKSQDRQDINNIKFKRFLLTTEPDHEGKLDSNLMKDICSDDKIINARALYKTDSRVPKKNTTIMECNNLPLLDNCNGQDALSERLNIIEFLSSFVSKDDKRLLLTKSKRKYYVANSKYVSEEWTESVKIALFDILLQYCIKFLSDKSIINDKPDIVKKTNSNYFLSSNEMKEWIVDNYYIGREEHINNKIFLRAKDVLGDFKMSGMYNNSSSKDKKKVLPNKWNKLMDEWFPEYFYKRKKIDGHCYKSILYSFVKKDFEK